MQNIPKIAFFSLVLYSFYIVSAPQDVVRRALRLSRNVHDSKTIQASRPMPQSHIFELALPQGTLQGVYVIAAGFDRVKPDRVVSVLLHGQKFMQDAIRLAGVPVDVWVDIDRRKIMTQVHGQQLLENDLIVKNISAQGLIDVPIALQVVFFVVVIDTHGNMYRQMIVPGQICRLVAQPERNLRIIPTGDTIRFSPSSKKITYFAMFSNDMKHVNHADVLYIDDSLGLINRDLAHEGRANVHITRNSLALIYDTGESHQYQINVPSDTPLIFVQDDSGEWFSLALKLHKHQDKIVYFIVNQRFPAQQYHGKSPLLA